MTDTITNVEGNYDEIIYDLDEAVAHKMNDGEAVGVIYTHSHGIRTGEINVRNVPVKLNVGLFSVCDIHSSACPCQSSDHDGIEAYLGTFTWRYKSTAGGEVHDLEAYHHIRF